MGHRIRQEAGNRFFNFKSCRGQCLTEGQLREGKVMVKEVPICATDVLDVWPQADHAASWFQGSAGVSKSFGQRFFVSQVLKKVTGKDDVQAGGSDSPGFAAVLLNDCHLRIGVLACVRIKFNAEFRRASDCIYELAVPASQIEYR